MFEGFDKRRLALSTGVNVRLREGGDGPAVLLLHGYPQTSACWHAVAPALVAAGYRVIAPDLRGYGVSDKPLSAADHSTYSKRAMAADQIALMDALGIDSFAVIGHDRGARVAHRLARDHGARITRIAVLDIAPTAAMYDATNREFATGYYHWFFLIQPAPLPERLIGADPAFYLRSKLGAWGKSGMDVYAPEALAEYEACFADPACIAATCEDYRASAGIDLEHDAEETAKLTMPLLALWGARGLVGRLYDVLAEWRAVADDVRGHPLDTGHFLPEEAPEATAAALLDFLRVS
ncbi:MAG: alpha/beta hydrolase [Pseudomonadota bacterium]